MSNRGAVFGPMAEVVHNSLQYMSDDDINAMATYLKTIPQKSEAPEPLQLETSEKFGGELLKQGQKIYADNCAKCHAENGLGMPPAFPPLANNQSIQMPSAVNPIRMVLNGGYPPSTEAQPASVRHAAVRAGAVESGSGGRRDVHPYVVGQPRYGCVAAASVRFAFGAARLSSVRCTRGAAREIRGRALRFFRTRVSYGYNTLMKPGRRKESCMSVSVSTALPTSSAPCCRWRGSLALVTMGALDGDAYKVVSFSVYGAMLFVLYAISTLYHSVRNPRVKAVLQKCDHSAIYLLIAGSYTPFTLVTLRGPWGWSLFGVSWGLAVLGIVQELTLGRRTRSVSMVLYVLMGWLALVAVRPLVQALPAAGTAWLVAGGIIYSAGIYFFINDERIRHGHGIWHLFVLAGSLCQFVSVARYVA